MQQRPGAALAQEPRDLHDGKDAAGLVVHEHHGDERRILAQRVRDLLRGDIPLTVGREIGDGIALLLQLTARLEHGAVLHGGGDDVLSDAAVLVGGKADGQLSLSVPQEVKYSSSGLQPSAAAMTARSASRRFFAAAP